MQTEAVLRFLGRQEVVCGWQGSSGLSKSEPSVSIKETSFVSSWHAQNVKLHKANGCVLPFRSLLRTSSCMSCWTSTGCFTRLAWMTSRIWKISWTDLRWEHSADTEKGSCSFRLIFQSVFWWWCTCVIWFCLISGVLIMQDNLQ